MRVAVFQPVPALGDAPLGRPDFNRKILELNLIPLTGDEGMLYGIFELAYIAGPLVV